MEELIGKLAAIERDFANKKGSFSLFALLLREDALPDRWDLVVAGPWMDDDIHAGQREIAEVVQSRLKSEEVIRLSFVVAVNSTDPRVREINREISVEHGLEKFYHREFFEMPMDKAIFITSRNLDSGVAA
ncbi:MAG: hypothetical protein WD894_08495 [Pirellulales bacterium]